MTNIVVGYPMAKAGNAYVNGLGLSVGTTNLLVNVAPGAARDSSGQVDIALPAKAIINMATNGVNGLDTGTIAASTFYYVYIIGDSLSANPETNLDIQVSTMASGSNVLNGIVIAEGSVATTAASVNNNFQPVGLASLSATAPTLPEGYDSFRRIGCILTGSGTTYILPFWQSISNDGVSRKMWYDAPISVLTATAEATFTAQSLVTAVPVITAAGGVTDVQLQVDLFANAAADFIAFRPTGSTAAAGNVKMSGDVAAAHHFDQIQVVAAIATGVLSIDWLTDSTSTGAFAVSAYIDNL